MAFRHARICSAVHGRMFLRAFFSDSGKSQWEYTEYCTLLGELCGWGVTAVCARVWLGTVDADAGWVG